MTPYNLGYMAYDDGQDVTDNPFVFPSWEYDAWLDGFNESQEHAYNEGN